jgi:hypothetical protein
MPGTYFVPLARLEVTGTAAAAAFAVMGTGGGTDAFTGPLIPG